VGVEFVDGPTPVANAVQTPGAKLPASLIVKSVAPGSPGQRAGLRPGDRITRIDDLYSNDVSYAGFCGVFFPAVGSPTQQNQLEVQRPGRPQPFVTSVLAQWYGVEYVFGASRRADNEWNFMLDEQNKLGYIRIGAIEELSPTILFSAMKSLSEQH